MTSFAEADAGIRQLHARFADAVWRQDAAEFAACFTADGLWKIAGMEVSGRAAIEEMCPKMLGRCSHIHLITGHAILSVEGERAQGRLAMTEFARMNDGSTAMTIGWYHDDYRQEGGRWRFARRHWSMKYRGPADLTGHYAETPDYGAFPGGPAADEPTYVRPVGV